MSITKSEALKIVTAIEEVSDYMESDDHSRAVVSSALGDLASRLGAALGVPACECRYSDHDETYGNQDCPRRGFGNSPETA